MMDRTEFRTRLSKYVTPDAVSDEDVLFGDGLNMTSLNITEFVMELEDEMGVSIDIERVENDVKTVGELYDFVAKAN